MEHLRILVAPSGFKESLAAEDVAAAIAAGIRNAAPATHIHSAPLVDGGEGTTVALVQATGGSLHPVEVRGPLDTPVRAAVGILGGSGPRTAVLEMAAAAGLRLVPRELRDPLRTSTYGVGELIRAALDLKAERILVGCGDSGTNDGGAGMAQALGARLLRADGSTIGRGGAALAELDQIDLAGLDPRLAKVPIDVACNIHNLLCGPRGVARVFGPQKGASAETVARLDAALEHYAALLQRDTGHDVFSMPGGGASGGLGAGLQALLGAQLHPRYDIIMRYLEFEQRLAEVELVITAEGGIDEQTPYGKIPAEVARRAQPYGLPVITLAGTVGRGASINYAHGIAAFTSILPRPCDLDTAIANAADWIAASAENVVRLLLVGRNMQRAA